MCQLARSVERFPNRELGRAHSTTRVPFKSNAQSFTTLRLVENTRTYFASINSSSSSGGCQYFK